jgi:hypothetical protein
MAHDPTLDRDDPAGRLAACEKDRAGAAFLLEIVMELVRAGESFLAPEAFLERCGVILRERLEADIAVCRLREKERSGDVVWRNVAVTTRDNQPTPIFVRDLVENLPGHPLMRAVREHPQRRCEVADLMTGQEDADDGCDESDLPPCKAGFRSRLSFILRSAGERPFGLVMLYSREVGFFARLDPGLLAQCAEVVSLIAGRLLDLGRDALAKAAGGMAHVGNNVLATLEGRLELAQNDLEVLFGAAPEPLQQTALAHLRAMQDDVARLARAISRLEQAVERPVLMHYALGRHVLDLEPERSGNSE